MAYSNINVGGKNMASDEQAYNDWVNQLRKDARMDASREALIKGSKAYQDESTRDLGANINAGEALIEDSAWVDDLYEQEEDYSYAVEKTEGKGDSKAKIIKANADQVASARPLAPGNNPRGNVYGGPAVSNYTDIENMNRGMVNQSIAEPLRQSIVNKDFEGAAAMLPAKDDLDVNTNEAVIRDHALMSGLVIKEMGYISTGWNASAADKYVNRVAKDLNADPESVAEFMRTWMTDFQTLSKSGVPQAFSDAALHATLQVMMRNKWSAKNKEEELLKTGVLNADEEHNASVAQDEEIGGLIEGAFNVSNGTPTTRAIGGALARRIVTEALGSVEYGDGVIEGRAQQGAPLKPGDRRTTYKPNGQVEYETSKDGLMKAGLFHSKLVKTNDGKTRWDIELTQKGAQYAESMSELGTLIIPGLRKDVNANPPQTEKFHNIMKSKETQHRQDPNRPAGEFKDTNAGIQVLNTTGFTIDSYYAAKLQETFGNPEAMEILEGKNFIDITGLEVNNVTYKKDANGDRFKESYVRSEIVSKTTPEGNPIRERNLNPGNKIHNPAFNPSDPESGELEWMTETNLGDTMKDMKFAETNEWIVKHAGDSSFYYTHKIGGAKRVHVEQTVGNYQSDKLVRSLIQAASKFTYSLKSKRDMESLKAGIMKKYGFNKAKHGNNAKLAIDFDTMVKNWVKLQTEFENQGGAGFALTLIEEAQSEEGWASLGAMSEGMRLHIAELDFKNPNTANNPQFTSKFLTEIDGTANGLAINSMMNGDESVAKLTGLLAVDPSDDFTAADDVYTITSNMFKAQFENYSGEALAKTFGHAWGELLPMYGNIRNLSKSSLMIFGYGAGEATIKQGFKEHLFDFFEGNAAARDKIHQITGNINQFIDLSGDMMVNSVETNFPQMRLLAKTLSSITGYAASLGIAPNTLTDDYDFVEFGLSQRIRNDDATFSGSYQNVSDVSKKKRGRRIEMTTFDRVNDPQGLVDKFGNRVTFDSRLHKIADLKAAKQAPVLVTQSMDALTMMRAIAKLKKKFGSQMAVGQIYDGILMPPMHAQAFSDALHQELYNIGKNYSSVNSLKEAIIDLDRERFHELARLNRKTKKSLTDDDKEFLEKNKGAVHFFFKDAPKISVMGKDGKKTYMSVLDAIRKIENARNKLIKKLDPSKMSQYGWNFK